MKNCAATDRHRPGQIDSKDSGRSTHPLRPLKIPPAEHRLPVWLWPEEPVGTLRPDIFSFFAGPKSRGFHTGGIYFSRQFSSFQASSGSGEALDVLEMCGNI